MAHHNIIIFSDLDGCLLDHNDYSFSAAKPLLQQLKQLDIPLILNSSKTQMEIEKIQAEMGIDLPFIIENGAAVFLNSKSGHREFETNNESLDAIDQYRIKKFAMFREDLLAITNGIKGKYKFRYKGFSDMSSAQIAELTQLSTEGAFAASQRYFSEPVLWQDNQAKLLQFKQLLSKHEIELVAGGRFIHLCSQYSKGQAMQWLVQHWQTDNDAEKTVIALGDSMNDVSMLNNSDYAIVIKNNGKKITAKGKIQTIYSSLPGTSGWVETLSALLNQLIPMTR